MKPYNQQEFNRLCAKFLGWEETSNGGFICIEKYCSLDYDSYYRGVMSSLKFHSDWNWIMEVKIAIEKIRIDLPEWNVTDWFEINIRSSYCLITSGLRYATGEIYSPWFYENYVHNKNIKEAVVEAIWQFLNWHNEQKQ